MHKGQISWTRRTETGERIEVDARRSGGRWVFRSRRGRPEQWHVLNEPLLEDWLELFDAVTRRIGRHLMRPEEASHLRKEILSRFPEADLPDR